MVTVGDIAVLRSDLEEKGWTMLGGQKSPRGYPSGLLISRYTRIGRRKMPTG